ncbi:MAG: hypothetical protein ACXADA_19765 [Candidatus Hodarchaeales archaeon]|jgi:hypothetical protein
MRRGKTQVIHRYLPGKVVDYTDTRSIGIVTHWSVEDLSSQIDKDRVAKEIIKLIKNKNYRPSLNYSRKLDTDSFVFLSPKRVYLDFFPLTLSCSKCYSHYTFNTIEDLTKRMQRSNYRCPKCKDRLTQPTFVHYHRCGLIESLYVPKCFKNPSHSFMKLEQTSSPSTLDWEWVCKKPGCGYRRSLFRNCPHCKEPMHTRPFRTLLAYIPKTITMLNVKSDEKIDYTENRYKLLLGAYLDLCTYETALKDMKSSEKTNSQVERINEMMLIAQDMPDGEGKEIMIMNLRDQLAELDTVNLQDVFSEIDSMGVNVDEYQDKIPVILDYLKLIHSLQNTMSLKDITTRFRSDGDILSLIRANNSKKALLKIGVKQAFVTTDFPIISLAYGYTRGTRNFEKKKFGQDDRIVLNDFERYEEYPDGFPIFTRMSETEAIILEYDRRKIIKWLSENKVISHSINSLTDDEMKLWFMEKVNSKAVLPFAEIPEDESITKYVYGLIHSINHLLLRRASGLIGLDKNSLSEMIIPEIPLAIIFANRSQDFHLGGFVTLFENNMDTLVNQAFMQAEQCLYDPLCYATTQACHACLYVSEISCTHYNYDLSREFLLGNGEMIQKGFLM